MLNLFNLFFITFLSFSLAFAQKEVNENSNSYFFPLEFKADEENLLSQVLPLINNDLHPNDWLLESRIESPFGIHIQYRQVISEIPIYGANLKINLDHTGNLLSIKDNSIPTQGWDSRTLTKQSQSASMNEIVDSEKFQLAEGYANSFLPQVVIFPGYNNQFPSCALQLFTEGNQSGIIIEKIVSIDGSILHERVINSFNSMPDSMVTAMVFMPDPITSAKVNYGGLYTDQNDADVAVLNAQRQQVNMRVNFTGTSFTLENASFIITDLASPNIAPITTTIPDFSFLRSDPAFEDVNAFYHLNNFYNYILNLGFSGIMPFQLQVDSHGTDDDNSFFLNSNPPRLILGEGGVDDAEDADVIIHELGHALAFGAAPNTTTGFERLALDEGLCDYFAASYSHGISDYKWYEIFNWDGHNEFWQGRKANSDAHYPEDLTSDIYIAGEIWSSAMMEIWGIIGKENTDKLMLQALYSFASNMNMRDAAQLVIQADNLINAGAYFEVLLEVFTKRGLMGIDENLVAGTISLLENNGNIAVYLTDQTSEGDIEIFDLQGRLIYRRTGVTNKITFLDRHIFKASGMYIVRLKIKDESISAKAIFVDN